MALGGNLSFAVSHAETVEALESFAPEVDPRSLQAAVDRCKLPITVRYVIRGALERWSLSWPTGDNLGECWHYAADSSDEAAAVYLCAVDSLSQSAALPTPADADTQRVGTAGTAPPVSASTSDPGSPTPAILPGSDPATSTGTIAALAGPVSFFPEGAR
jgi:hypothetical protein